MTSTPFGITHPLSSVSYLSALAPVVISPMVVSPSLGFAPAPMPPKAPRPVSVVQQRPTAPPMKSTVAAGRGGLPPGVEAWMLIVVQLPLQWEYTLRTLVNAIGLDERTLAYHCQNLFERRQRTVGNNDIGERRRGKKWALSFDQMVDLVLYTCNNRKTPIDAPSLWADLIERGAIDMDFPRGSRIIELAQKHLVTREEKRLEALYAKTGRPFSKT